MISVVAVETWQWDEASFVKAWEAGVFGDTRVELVRGEVWPVAIGDWHGVVAANIARALPDDSWQVTFASLPSAGSVPDPDMWVQRRGASPLAWLGAARRLARWSPSDVGLVVEVSDVSFAADTEVKPLIYGAAGYPCYWVVHRGGMEVFDIPFEEGYRRRQHVGPDGAVTVPYAGSPLAVATLLEVGA